MDQTTKPTKQVVQTKWGLMEFDISWTPEQIQNFLYANKDRFNEEADRSDLYTGLTQGAADVVEAGGGGLSALGADTLGQTLHEAAGTMRAGRESTIPRPDYLYRAGHGEFLGATADELQQSLGYMAPGLAASLINPAAPLAVYGTQHFGSNINRQVQEGTPYKDVSFGTAAATAVPQAFLERMGVGTLGKFAGAGKGLNLVEKAVYGELAKKGVGARLVGKALLGAAEEAPGEIGTQMLERGQAGLPIFDQGAGREYTEAGMLGAVMGGMAAPLHAQPNASPVPPIQQTVAPSVSPQVSMGPSGQQLNLFEPQAGPTQFQAPLAETQAPIAKPSERTPLTSQEMFAQRDLFTQPGAAVAEADPLQMAFADHDPETRAGIVQMVNNAPGETPMAKLSNSILMSKSPQARALLQRGQRNLSTMEKVGQAPTMAPQLQPRMQSAVDTFQQQTESPLENPAAVTRNVDLTGQQLTLEGGIEPPRIPTEQPAEVTAAPVVAPGQGALFGPKGGPTQIARAAAKATELAAQVKQAVTKPPKAAPDNVVAIPRKTKSADAAAAVRKRELKDTLQATPTTEAALPGLPPVSEPVAVTTTTPVVNEEAKAKEAAHAKALSDVDALQSELADLREQHQKARNAFDRSDLEDKIASTEDTLATAQETAAKAGEEWSAVSQQQNTAISGVATTPGGVTVADLKHQISQLRKVQMASPNAQERAAAANQIQTLKQTLAKLQQGDFFKKSTTEGAGTTVQAVTDVLRKLLGDGFRRAVSSQAIVFHDTVEGDMANAAAWYDPSDDRVHFNLSRLSENTTPGVILHELGVHAGFANAFGEQALNQFTEALRVLAAKDARARSAYAAALAESGMDVDEYLNGAPNPQAEEEALAYFVEQAVNSGYRPALLQRVLSAIKQVLAKWFGVPPRTLGITDADMVQFAKGAADYWLEGFNGPTGPGGGVEITDIHNEWDDGTLHWPDTPTPGISARNTLPPVKMSMAPQVHKAAVEMWAKTPSVLTNALDQFQNRWVEYFAHTRGKFVKNYGVDMLLTSNTITGALGDFINPLAYIDYMQRAAGLAWGGMVGGRLKFHPNGFVEAIDNENGHYLVNIQNLADVRQRLSQILGKDDASVARRFTWYAVARRVRGMANKQAAMEKQAQAMDAQLKTLNTQLMQRQKDLSAVPKRMRYYTQVEADKAVIQKDIDKLRKQIESLVPARDELQSEIDAITSYLVEKGSTAGFYGANPNKAPSALNIDTLEAEQYGITPGMVNVPGLVDAIIQEAETTPEMKELFELMRNIVRQATQSMEESGLITADHRAALDADADYVNLSRVAKNDTDLLEGVYSRKFSRRMYGDTEFYKLKGAGRDVSDVFENTMDLLRRSYMMSVKNHANAGVVQGLQYIGNAEVYDSKAAVPDVDMARTVPFRVAGVDRYATLSDPMDFYTFNGPEQVDSGLLRSMTKIANFQRKAIVMMPDFIFRQLPQDAINAAIFSGTKNPAATIGGVVKEFWSAVGGKKNFERMLTSGMPAQNLVTLTRDGITGMIDHYEHSAGEMFPQLTTPPKTALGKAGFRMNQVANYFMHLGEASDAAQRKAVYDQVYKDALERYNGKGYSPEQAQLAARMAAAGAAQKVMNYHDCGASPAATWMRRTVPFFNTMIQGLNVTIKLAAGRDLAPHERSEAYKRVGATMIKLASVAAVYALMTADDDDLEGFKPEQRMRNFYIKIPGTTTYAVIPTRPEVGFFWKAIPESIIRAMSREDTGAAETFAALGKGFREGWLPMSHLSVFVPSAVRPAIEEAVNMDTYRGEPIVGGALEGLPASEQFNMYTGDLAKTLGQMTGMSPVRIDHVLRGYLGGVAAYTNLMTHSTLRMIDPQIEPPQHFYEMPIANAFFKGPTAGALKQALYDAASNVEEHNRAWQKALLEGRIEDAKEWADLLQKDAEAGMSISAAAHFKEALAGIQRAKQATAGAAMDGDEKQRQLDDLDAMERQYAYQLRNLMREQKRRQ